MSPHDAWVRRGKCPSINWSKAWCNLEAGHAGLHMSMRAFPDGHEEPLYWNRAAAHQGEVEHGEPLCATPAEFVLRHGAAHQGEDRPVGVDEHGQPFEQGFAEDSWEGTT